MTSHAILADIADTFVDIQRVTKTYRSASGEMPVLSGVDLRLERGTATALVGVSGTGKSTLLNILGGIESPDSGQILVDRQPLGTNPKSLAEHRRQRVGFVFQFYNLLPLLTVLENVLTGLEAQGQLPQDARDQARDALQDVGLLERETAYPAELSGGQQQRVAIARAMVKQAPLILADEPTGNLDPHTGEQILETLFERCQAHGSTLVVVTHNQTVAARTDFSATLVDGRIRGWSPA